MAYWGTLGRRGFDMRIVLQTRCGHWREDDHAMFGRGQSQQRVHHRRPWCRWWDAGLKASCWKRISVRGLYMISVVLEYGEAHHGSKYLQSYTPLHVQSIWSPDFLQPLGRQNNPRPSFRMHRSTSQWRSSSCWSLFRSGQTRWSAWAAGPLAWIEPLSRPHSALDASW